MTIESELQHYIATEVVLGDVQPHEPLISSGRVDSLGLLQILSYIDQQYGATLLSDGSPRDFETVNALAAAIRRHQKT
jgi:acyl carrier protein